MLVTWRLEQQRQNTTPNANQRQQKIKDPPPHLSTMKTMISQSLQQRALLVASIAALFIVSGESFVQADKKHHRTRCKAMCFFSTTKNDQEPSETKESTQESVSDKKQEEEEKEKGFKVQTWNPFRLAVLKLGMTEFPATSPFNYGKYNGEFTCAYCGNVLFDSNSKYDSGSGWPSFWRTAQSTSIDYLMELDGRLECRCQKCSSHLGHVFLDGPGPSTVDQSLLEASPESDPRGKTGRYLPRFCINGAAMKFRDRQG